jgi:hypothetical protein
MPQWQMGPAIWLWDGVKQDVYTKGSEFTVTPQTQAVEFDIVGHADDIETDLQVTAKIAIALAPKMDISAFIPYINKIVDGDKVLYDGVVDIGRSLRDRGKALMLHPANLPESDVSEDFYMPKAVCTSEFHVVYDNTTVRIIEATFTGYVDDLTSKRKFQIGDRTAAADITPPTVGNTTPQDDATGVAKASGLHIDIVMSEAIQEATAIKSNTIIQKASDGSLFTDYSVTYISALNTIRFTTTAVLAATTEYRVIITNGIKDLAGNVLVAPYVLTFTTGA